MTKLVPKMDPKLIKIDWENPENLQNDPKNNFLRDLFFDDFLKAKKLFF